MRYSAPYIFSCFAVGVISGAGYRRLGIGSGVLAVRLLSKATSRHFASKPMTENTAPTADQIEISVFGRGQGEAILIHYGDRQWMLIDCLRNSDGDIAPLHYLRDIGQSPQDALRMIVATHWHDDHIRGLAEVYAEAVNAPLVMPIAMRQKELQAFQGRARKGGSEKISSGVGELDRIAVTRQKQKRVPFKAVGAHTILLRTAADDLAHGNPVSIETLSPSPADIEAFLHTVSAKGAPDRALLPK